MSDSVLHIVIAHGVKRSPHDAGLPCGQAIFDSNLKHWARVSGGRIVVVSPSNNPVVTNHDHVTTGNAESGGYGALARLKAAMNECVRNGFGYVIINESDSVCFEIPASLSPGLFGIVIYSHGYEGGMSSRYSNAPWIVDRKSCEMMLEKASQYPALFDNGSMDRHICSLASLCGIPLIDHSPKGFRDELNSRPDIGFEKWHLELAISAARRGCRMFHGLKRPGVSDAIWGACK